MTLHKGKRRPFQKDTIGTILANQVYIGMVRYKHGEWREGRHEAIIDSALWNSVQEIRLRRSHQSGGRLPVRGMGGLLSEVVYCGKCGARMHSQVSGVGASRQRYYRCSNRRRYSECVCGAKFVQASKVEAQLLDVLRALTLTPPIRDAVIQVVQDLRGLGHRLKRF